MSQGGGPLVIQPLEAEEGSSSPSLQPPATSQTVSQSTSQTCAGKEDSPIKADCQSESTDNVMNADCENGDDEQPMEGAGRFVSLADMRRHHKLLSLPLLVHHLHSHSQHS